MRLPRLQKMPLHDSPTLIKRKEIAQTICNFQKLQKNKNLVSAHFSRNPYLSSENRRSIPGMGIGYTLRQAEGEIVSSTVRSRQCVRSEAVPGPIIAQA